MSIQRYDLDNGEGSPARMLDDPAGDYVTYADHAAELARVTAERDAVAKQAGVLINAERQTSEQHCAEAADLRRQLHAAVADNAELSKALALVIAICWDDGIDVAKPLMDFARKYAVGDFGDKSVEQVVVEIVTLPHPGASLLAERERLARRVEEMGKVLRRIAEWDHMDTAGDGPHWRREIAAALKGTP